MHRHVPQDDSADAAARAADRSQAEYFLAELTASCTDINRRIAKYRTAMQRYEAQRNVGQVRRCRQAIRAGEHERQRIEWMIDGLHRRFRPSGPSLSLVSDR